jgi:hypothetical protein
MYWFLKMVFAIRVANVVPVFVILFLVVVFKVVSVNFVKMA